MIGVDEARRAVLSGITRLDEEDTDLLGALGRVLARRVVSDIDVAPFDNSAMDGYAVRSADIAEASEGAPVSLDVVEHVPAGAVPARPVGHGQASRIMTGAPMPEGADAVVMVEYTRSLAAEGGAGGVVGIERPVERGENVRLLGEDVRKGQVVLAEGEVVDSAAVGLMAATGTPRPHVFRRPRVAVVSTGDELVPISESPGPGRIRNSNAWSLSAQVLAAGGIPERLPIVGDTEDETRAALERAGEFDAMLSTGGVSVGDFDVVRDVLATLGEMSFWKVAMRPGAPLTFGHIDGTPFFGLPGNPTSSMVSFELFARPALRLMQGHATIDRPLVRAVLTHDVKKKADRRYFLRGRLAAKDGGYEVALTGSQSSALLTSMHQADCLCVFTEGEPTFPAGTVVDCMRLDVEEGTP
jgi:molybdopterin molybdotransferase